MSAAACRVCAPYLELSDRICGDAKRKGVLAEYGRDDELQSLENLGRKRAHELDAHASVLFDARRPYPHGHSLPDFIEVERHFGGATFELDPGANRYREDYQAQFWAPTWVKAVTCIYSSMVPDNALPDAQDAYECVRDEWLWKASNEPNLRLALDSALRLDGREAVRSLIPLPHLGDTAIIAYARQPRLEALLRAVEQRNGPRPWRARP